MPVPSERVDTATMSRLRAERRKRRLANHVGGLPLTWLATLHDAHPRAVLVGLLIKRAVDMAGGTQPVTVSRDVYDQVGLTEMMFRRALEALEHKGIVQVERHRGRLPRITLLEMPERPS